VCENTAEQIFRYIQTNQIWKKQSF
jgi:hypothetical protein